MKPRVIQIARLRRRHGLSEAAAHLIAALHYGEAA
ncbi:hypothetical protein SAMN05216236_12316 [Sedimentitalea nanhaiensis]|uniref:Uncharacterized protein n=1 Tax=Sedimentitalea nanhaiensis TaxID=999627 RepID=A0A1I7D5H2_9RHOB|nr:hypothetical protein SAMN05216236_12316 [Sedimentitalea nanhaiensis]